jgi:hypothetical protein
MESSSFSLLLSATGGTNPIKISAILDDSCDMLLKWIQVSHLCHHSFQ